MGFFSFISSLRATRMASMIVPITLMETNNRGLRMEKIDHYIKERGEEPEHKTVLSSIVGTTSKEKKLNAARRIKLYVEAGEDLAPIYNEFNAQLTDKGELRRVFDEYKALREGTIDRMNSARNQLPENLRNFNDTPVPISIVNSHGVEKICEYIEARRSDPRDTKSFAASMASIFGNDAHTKKGKLRAARLLELGVQAGVPLAMIFNAESAAFGEGTLKNIYTMYEKAQQEMQERLVRARKQLAGGPSSEPPSALSKRHDDLRKKYARNT